MKRIYSLLVLPALLALCSSPLPARAAESVPFIATASTVKIGSAPDACGLVFTNVGTGQATHLGLFTLLDQDCGHPPTYLSYDGTLVLTAANGDQLTLATHGAYDLGTKIETATFTVSGGTGRFQGATGDGVLIRDYNSRVYALDGTIDYKKQ